MDAKTVRRGGLSLWLGLALAAPVQAQDATYFDGPTLARRLLHNLVRIDAEDIDEHGFGYVVGADADTLWVATARHVVVRVGMRGSNQPALPSQRLRARLCGATQGDPVEARLLADWNDGGQDIALLALPRPAGFEPLARALAPAAKVDEEAWVLGRDEQCAVVPAPGRVRALTDAQSNLRVDFAGVLGGSSGGAVASARGVIGLMKSADDLTTTVHDMADLQRRIGARWQLIDAKNLPPGEPRTAETDLAETMHQYRMALRNVHGLFQMRTVARPTIDDYLKRYNAAVERFDGARDRHNGTLSASWSPAVLQRWQALAERLWAVHLNFWRINAQMEEIYRSQKTSDAVRQQMQALEPAIQDYETEMAQFLRLLAKESP